MQFLAFWTGAPISVTQNPKRQALEYPS